MSWFESALDLLSPGWVGSLIGLAGLIAAVVVYILTRRRTSLSCTLGGERLLGLSSAGLPPGITVQYGGRSIPRLTRSLVVLWNSGENTINGDDIVDTDPLRFCVDSDGEILSVQVLKTTREVNGVVIAPPSLQHIREAAFSFKFLDASDGFVVEILHTSKIVEPTILGTIRGIPSGINRVGRTTAGQRKSKKSSAQLLKYLNGFAILFGAAVVCLAVFLPEQYLNPGNKSVTPGWVLIAAGTANMFVGAMLTYAGRRRYPKHLHLDALGSS